jgi:hypothetical protein
VTPQSQQAHFVELPGERASRGSFAIINEILAWSRAYKLHTGQYLSCIHSETANRLFEQVQNSKLVCMAQIDVRHNLEGAPLKFPGGAHNPVRVDEIKELQETFKYHFKIRQQHLPQDSSMDHAQGPILGIHLRGTDKYKEVIPPTRKQILVSIRGFIRNYPVASIYLATDDLKLHTLIERNFPDLLLPTFRKPGNSSRSPSHLGELSDKELLEIDGSAAVDAITLAGCDYFLYSHSNLSYFSLVIGHGHHKVIEPILMGKPNLLSILNQKFLITRDNWEDLSNRFLRLITSRFRK